LEWSGHALVGVAFLMNVEEQSKESHSWYETATLASVETGTQVLPMMAGASTGARIGLICGDGAVVCVPVFGFAGGMAGLIMGSRVSGPVTGSVKALVFGNYEAKPSSTQP
jgi:hypothetical protein